MEPKFQTSFIPKAPVSSTGATVRPLTTTSSSISFLPSIATILFVGALLSTGGLFFYERSIRSQIAEDGKALVLAKQAFDTAAIDKLTIASQQIRSAKALINSHVAISNLFALFESKVLPKARFTVFDFQRSPVDKTIIKISVEGEAQSYADMAEQSALFSTITYMKNQVFTDLDLTDKGAVSMKFQATIDPSLVSYKQAVEALNAEVDTTTVDTSPVTDTSAGIPGTSI